MTNVPQTEEKIVQFGDFTFTPETCTVQSCSGKSARLVAGQCAILCDLIAAKGEIVSKERLYKKICERADFPPKPRIIDTQIYYLRRTLCDMSVHGGDHIITVFGVGYVFLDEPMERQTALREFPGSRTDIRKRLDEACSRYEWGE